MKKALTIILSLAIGAALGLLIGSLGRSSMSNDQSTLSATFEIAGGLVALLIAAYLQIVLHEAGHLVCGLLSGYRFVSFRIMSITLIKDGEGKLRFKRFKLAGTGGQCLMTPPANVAPEHLPTALYNAGGVLSNLLWATLALLALLYCDNMNFFFKYFLASTMVVGYAFALINGITEVVGRFVVPVALWAVAAIGVWGCWWSVGIVWFLSALTAWLRYLYMKKKI